MAKVNPPRPDETLFDRFMRFGTALFAVRKDELPARDEPAKPKRPAEKGEARDLAREADAPLDRRGPPFVVI